ncbi:MAG: hypothetical protein GY899_08230, partial [Verrucomicrobiaceae bacterium]|nr:hypothetical protein [Verrucomicrobiaceae bacterium]
GDADEDGIPNLAEYGFGTNPRSSNPSAMPSASTITLNGQRYLTITYQKSLTANDISIDVQRITDLRNWVNDETLITVSETVTPDGGSVILTRRMTSPLSSQDYTYLRVIVTF